MMVPLQPRRSGPAPSSRSRIDWRANFMCRDSSTTWILLVVRTIGSTFSPFIQSRCMTSRTSSATRMRGVGHLARRPRVLNSAAEFDGRRGSGK